MIIMSVDVEPLLFCKKMRRIYFFCLLPWFIFIWGIKERKRKSEKEDFGSALGFHATLPLEIMLNELFYILHFHSTNPCMYICIMMLLRVDYTISARAACHNCTTVARLICRFLWLAVCLITIYFWISRMYFLISKIQFAISLKNPF